MVIALSTLHLIDFDRLIAIYGLTENFTAKGLLAGDGVKEF